MLTGIGRRDVSTKNVFKKLIKENMFLNIRSQIRIENGKYGCPRKTFGPRSWVECRKYRCPQKKLGPRSWLNTQKTNLQKKKF